MQVAGRRCIRRLVENREHGSISDRVEKQARLSQPRIQLLYDQQDSEEDDLFLRAVVPWGSTSDVAAPWLGGSEVTPASEIEQATAEAGAKGVDQSIKDAIGQAIPLPSLDKEMAIGRSKVGQPSDETIDV